MTYFNAQGQGRVGWRSLVVTQVVNAVDADAQAFITAAGITNLTQASAINTLVNDLKTYGLWTKMKALYPMVGGSATSHKFNLKDPRDLDAAYRLVFNGGWTHTSTGALPNGTTGYADTKLKPNNALLLNSNSLGYYSGTNISETNPDMCNMGSFNSVTQAFLLLKSNSNYVSRTNGNVLNYNSSLMTGLMIASRQSSTVGVINVNGVNVVTGTANGTLSTENVWLGNLNTYNFAYNGWVKNDFRFAHIGDGLSDTEAANFYNSVQKFQTTLGRQIGSPIVSDTDAQAFINAAGLTDLGQANAVNTLVVDLKAAGVWTKMKALYPFVGGTATTHKWNLKDPRDLDAAFRLVFTGGWTHSATGVLPNGTTGYANTFLVPSSTLSTNSTHISYYSRTNNTSVGSDFGTYNIYYNNRLVANIKYTDGNTYFRVNRSSGQPDGTIPIADSRLFYMINRTSSSQEILFTNTTKNTFNYNSTNLSAYSIFLGATNISNSPSNYGNKESAFASIGDGLTDTEASAFYTAVQKYQTSLGRQIGTPVLAEGQTAGLLETYSGAAAAYSLRKLRNGYVGNAIRVRRSSDNTEQDIAFNNSGGLDTVSLLAFVGSGNGFVTTWYDQSGFNNHSSQTTAANQPNIVNAGVLRTINGKPSIYFSGAQLFTTTTNVLSTGNASYSIHGVSYNIGTSSSTLFYLGDASGNSGVGIQIISGGLLRHFWYTKEFVSNTNSINLQTYYAIKFDGTNVYTSVNNTTTNLGTGTKTTTNPTLSIGKMKNWNEYYVGHQQELVLFDLYNNPTTESGIKTSINTYYTIY